MDNWRWQGAEEPEGWSKGKKAFVRERSDFLLKDIVPSMSTVLGGAPARPIPWVCVIANTRRPSQRTHIE